jgi:hypothetical protein
MTEAMGDSTELTVHERTANYFSGVVFVVAVGVFGVPFALVWGWKSLILAFQLFLTQYLILAISILLGVVLHEALHGLTWAFFCKEGTRSIRYGIKWAALAPYAQCNEILPINRYRLGAIMPCVALGIVPAVMSVFIGNGWLLMFGIFFTAGAAGDFLILWKLRPYDAGHRVLDHPEKIGCLVSKYDHHFLKLNR